MSDRILTVKNPWGEAIVSGVKPIENRGFAPSWRGTLWVHAGLGIDREAMMPPCELRAAYRDWGLLPRGVVIGRVDLVDVVTDSDSEWAQPGCFHWVLENPERCEPFVFRGALGLRPFDPMRLLNR